MRNRYHIEAPDLQRALLSWYGRCGRDLPWRRRRDAYAVWVSEVMLQQTRVDTVIPYFHRWMARFPDVQALAAAPLADVLKTWEGLGYYSRARNLHRAAEEVVRESAGLLPRDAQGLRCLSGIGRYTAGAIASIAMGLDEPVVDGNVARILARLLAIRGDIKSPSLQRRLWQVAADFLPGGRAGDFNQALMDLGATVCLPRSPRCGECPIHALCRTNSQGSQHRLPSPRPRRKIPHYDVVAAIILRPSGGAWKVLIDRRPEDAMLGGLWEFPGGKPLPGETHEQALVREVAEEVGIAVAPRDPLGGQPLLCTVRHTYSHFRITMHAYLCRHLQGRPRAIECSAVKWVAIDEISRYAFPRANRHVIDALRKHLPI